MDPTHLQCIDARGTAVTAADVAELKAAIRDPTVER